MLKKEFTLREYQHAFNRNLAIAVKEHRRVIGCAATGAGKSKTFLTIASNAVKKGLTVLVITESRKIYKQLIAEVHAFEIKPGSNPPIIKNRIYLAMAQTLRRRENLLKKFEELCENLLIINDECHINEATNILLRLSAALLIGFSGSPVGKHLVKLYNHLVVGPQPHQLVLEGFLSPYIHFERKRADISQLELDNSGEYTESSQERVFSTDKVYEGLIEDLNNTEFVWKKALIFTSSIKHCEETAERLRAAGLKCVTVHSGLKEKEEYNLLQFTHGLIPICVSVGILTKGFDYPPIDCIAILRKTTSLALYLQMIGRASRVLSGEEILPVAKRTKKYFTVFDYGQNVTRHLPWDFARDWQELWRTKPKAPGVSPIKVCPQCNFVNTASAKTCAHCGYIWMTFQIQEEPENIETILVQVTAKYNKLVGRNISSLTASELAIYAKAKGVKNFAMVVAKRHVINGDREFIKHFAVAMDYKWYWVKVQLDLIDAMQPEEREKAYKYKDFILQ